MPLSLPEQFLARIENIIPAPFLSSVLDVFSQTDPVVLRINTLKTDHETVLDLLAQQGVIAKILTWHPDVLIVSGLDKTVLSQNSLVAEGAVYFQNLSSLLPPLVLGPQPGDSVLDLCAAPGSKTTQMAAMMRNEGKILAVETVKPRFYKLKSVCELLGVTNVTFKLMDGRYLRIPEEALFDKVLVDAPCSSEGRFKAFDPKSVAYWSPRKIKEMTHKQKGLLLNASRLLKPGGTLIYSTCTFAPEENEAVVDWVLRKAEGLSLVPITLPPAIPTYPPLSVWQGKSFKADLSSCVRVLPDGNMSGFFLAGFRKE